MTIALAFWIIFLVAAVFGVGASVWTTAGKDWRGAMPSLVVLVLIFLLGWAVFGAPIK